MPNSSADRRLNALIYRSYLKNSLIPIFAIEVVLLLLYFGITLYVSGKNQEFLLQEATRDIQEIASREVASIEGKFLEVSRLSQLMQRDHEAFFASSACVLPNGEPGFEVHPNGAYYKTGDNGGASVYYAASTAIGEAQRRKARCSEVIDPLLKSIVTISPVVTQAYLNTWDDMNRLYPFMPDAPSQYGAAINMEDYNFYYLADASHNPQRTPVWTGAYLDPAGQGWMISLIVPIYRGDVLEGVSGLDVTITSFVQQILGLRMPWRAATFMVDGEGTILAMQERAERILRLDELKSHVYDSPIGETVEKPDEYNILKHGDPSIRDQTAGLFESAARIGELNIDGTRYLVSQEIVPETGWRMISLIERQEVLAPIERLKRLSDRIGYLAIAGMVLFYIGFFLYMVRNSREVSSSIAEPIGRLSELTQDLGATLRAKAFQPVGIEEIDRLGNHFNEMSGELEVRTQALVDAKLAAESASRAKSAFLANMSHELRTPLNGIIGMSSIALRDVKEPAQRRRLEVIERSSKHLLDLIRDILDISAIESERLEIREEPFILRELLLTVNSLFAQEASAKGLSIRVDAEDGLEETPLLGDPLRLGQVLNNLCGNAVKFSDSGGIDIRLGRLSEDDTGLTVRFEVEDHGIGISPEDQRRLFKVFSQADDSLSRRYGGTGLGLAISKRLVEAMGGKIGLHSVPAEGSTFWFEVPLKKAGNLGQQVLQEQPVESQIEQLRQRFSGCRVLLVEDDRVNQAVARELLEQAGLAVELAENGEQGLAMASEQRFDLVLMDQQMPMMNGLEATERIRSQTINAHTPILAMTASAFEKNRHACLASGMNDFLAKPVETQTLYKALLHWLGVAQESGEGSDA